MSPFALLRSDPVEGDLVALPVALLEFFKVWPWAEFESGWKVVVFLALLSVGDENGWAGAWLLWKIGSVVSVEEPVVMGEVSLVKPEEVLVRLAVLDQIVDWPSSCSFENFNSDFPDVVVEGSVGIDATEPVEWSAVILLDSVVVGQGQGLGQNFSVNWSLVVEVKPKLWFACWGQGFTLLGEGLLEVDAAGGSLDVGLDGEEFFMNEIVLDEGVGLLLESGEGFVLVWSGLGHLSRF